MDARDYIQILLQDLKKKTKVLDAILDANQRQKMALEDPNLDPDDFDVIVEEKDALIEQIETLDDGFQQIYEHVRSELQQNKDAYAKEIAELQSLIRGITSRSAEIQTGEKRNQMLMQQRFSEIKKQLREVRASQKMVSQYYNNMMKKNFLDPQFMDNKK